MIYTKVRSNQVWIGSFKLQKNIPVPHYVEDYIKLEVHSLSIHLRNTLGNEYRIYSNGSIKSESCYLFIENTKTGNKQIVSFRNHDNFAKAIYDKTIDLSRFKTWEKCRKHFLKRKLPMILSELKIPLD